MKMSLFLLSCNSDSEAKAISHKLLEKKLVTCAKRLPVSALYLWKGKIKNGNEVLLLLESIEENFEQVESEVKQLHSDETFVLMSFPVSKTTEGVKQWLKDELK